MSDFLKALLKLLYPGLNTVINIKNKIFKTFRRDKKDDGDKWWNRMHRKLLMTIQENV